MGELPPPPEYPPAPVGRRIWSVSEVVRPLIDGKRPLVPVQPEPLERPRDYRFRA